MHHHLHHHRSGPRARRGLLLAGLLATSLAAAACGGSSGSTSAASTATTGVTINVVLASDPPPKAAMDEFTKETGITVNWTNVDWDSLQTKISAAAAANTYFADATDVDWSRVGQFAKLDWFLPMETLLDTKSMEADVPQLASFTEGGHVIGVPYDASFMVTTINKEMFDKGKQNPAPTTMDAYTQSLKALKASGVQYPLNIPFAAAEGLSTYWYETTNAFGGQVLDKDGKPLFATPDTPGYKAAVWMIDAFKSGLVPPGNINVTDSQGQQTLMAKGQVASTFSDYSGVVGTVYNIPDSSSVVNKVEYLPTPGVSAAAGNLSNPDGIGVPKQAKYPQAAAKFIDWFTQSDRQAEFAGLNGPEKAFAGYFMPSHLSAVQKLADKGTLNGGDILAKLLAASKPVFAEGAPAGYPEFSNAFYTNLHAAAVGSMTPEAAIAAIAAVANKLASGS